MPRPKQRHTSTWSGGQRQDLHPALQIPDSYVHASGLIFRFAKSGGGMVLTPEIPVKLAAVLPVGFSLLGGGKTPDQKVILFLSNGSASLIGRLDAGTTTILYDDSNDPFGDKLNFPVDAHMQVRVEKETENLTRIYFNDEINPPRVISLSDYPGSGVSYTNVWSAHAFATQPTVNWGRIYFDSFSTGGSLLSGHYRYSYRYRLGSALSTPFNLSLPLHLRQSQLETDMTKPIQMEASGVATLVKMNVVVENIDTRWNEVELLVSYSPDGDAWSDMVVATRKAIVSPTMTLTHDRDAGIGEIVLLSRLQEVDQHIVQAGAQGLEKHKLLYGNLRLALPTAGPLPTATLSPFVEDMPLDEAGNPTQIGPGTFPLAYTLRRETTLTTIAYTRRAGGNKTTSLPVHQDFQDYKGTQVGQSRVGYRRGGESYPVAAVLYDLLGQPTYAWPLGTFTTPNAYDNLSGQTGPWAPTRISGSSFFLERMGLRVSNLQLPYNVLYDNQDRLKVSGLSIVRGPASGRIAHQGVALPACWEFGGRDNVITDLPTFRNNWSDVADQDGFGLFREVPANKTDSGNRFNHRQGWIVYHSPELFVNGRIDESPANLNVRLVGSVHGNDSQVEQATLLDNAPQQLYVKAYRYRGDTIRSTAIGRPQVGEITKVRYAYRTKLNETLEHFYPEYDPFIFSPGVTLGGFNNSDNTGPSFRPRTLGLSRLAEGSYLMKVDGYSLVDRGESLTKPAGYAIVNCEVNVELPSPVNIPYQYAGHYQPINQAVLDDLPVSGSGNSRVWTINNAEVWGGDTFLSRVDYARMMPFYDYDDGDYALHIGFGHSMFVPIESKYNLALRYGRTYEKVGTMPDSTARTSLPANYTRAINVFQPEDWNINAGLKVTETVKHFSQLPDDVRLELSWPQGVAWSKLKTDGERFDSYRRFPSTNLYLLEGERGRVNALVNALNGLYAVQDTGIARVQVDERQLVSNQQGELLKIADVATGREVGPAEYITVDVGAQRPQHVWISPRAFYFFDARVKKWNRFSQAGLEPLSDRDGLHDFLLTQDLTNWSGAFDLRDDTVHLLGPNTRLTYNEALNVFVMESDAMGTRWISAYNETLLAQLPGFTSLYETGRFSPSAELTFIVNPIPGQPKQFQTGILSASEQFCDKLTQIVITSEDQQYFIYPPTDERVRWREGRLWIPLRTMEAETPLRGSTMKVQLIFNNLVPTEVYWLLKHETDYEVTFRV